MTASSRLVMIVALFAALASSVSAAREPDKLDEIQRETRIVADVMRAAMRDQLRGEVRLTLGDDTVAVTTGDMVSLPAGIPHIFQVVSEQAEMLTIAGGGGTWPGFDQFVAELGEPTDPAALPASVEIDPGHVAQVAARHGIEILGPPPPPLD